MACRLPAAKSSWQRKHRDSASLFRVELHKAAMEGGHRVILYQASDWRNTVGGGAAGGAVMPKKGRS